MINAVLGKKLRQTQTFDDKGNRLAVTEIIAGPCVVTDIKTSDRDGYQAVQLGFGLRKAKNTSKPVIGHLKKAGRDEKSLPCFLREVRIKRDKWEKGDKGEKEKDTGEIKMGDVFSVGQAFAVGDVVQATGVSKGKGWAGVVKRWGFAGGPRTHGQSDRERAPGSIGQTTTPGRVYKGKKMAGRMGNERKTVKNLKVIAIDAAENLLTVSGLVPGGRNGLLIIQKIN